MPSAAVMMMMMMMMMMMAALFAVSVIFVGIVPAAEFGLVRPLHAVVSTGIRFMKVPTRTSVTLVELALRGGTV